jgi:Predicted hydrocarbon binding protein (contains V4R domain)
MEEGRKYQFSWDLIGDIEKGRPNLGPTLRIEAYRLMQFCMRDVVEEEFGTDAADRIFYKSGYLAGQNFFEHIVGKPHDLGEFIHTLQSWLKDLAIGVLRVEKSDPESGTFVMTVSEDLDCSGLPELDYEICTYDEGFIAALLDRFTGRSYEVREIDCWCTGDRTCRFRAVPRGKSDAV